MTSTYIERPVSRHSSGMGSVLEFQAEQRYKVIVADSVYRDVKPWGTCGFTARHPSEYRKLNKYRNWYLESTGLPVVSRFSDIDDNELNRTWGGDCGTKSAKENCDFWMSIRTSSKDLCADIGAPAVEHARSVSINGVGCDVPNLQTVMRIFLEADRIDQLDPTVSDNPNKALGSMNPNGYWDSMGAKLAWASTAYSVFEMRHINKFGHCYASYKGCPIFVIPIQELEIV